MYRQRIQQNILLIDSLIDLNQHPTKTISLFYSTVKMIQKSHLQLTNASSQNRGCFQIINTSDQIDKNSWKLQQLFTYFLSKNHQLHSQLDKVNSHMLKITAQIIAHINQTQLHQLYQQQYIDNKDNNNKLKKVKSQTSFRKFQHLFTDTLDGIEKGNKVLITRQQKGINKNINTQISSKINQNTVPIINQNIPDNKTNPTQEQNTQSERLQPINIHSSQLNIQTILKLYQEHKIDRSYQLLTFMQTHSPHLIKIEKQQNPLFNQIISEIKQEYNQMIHFYQHFDLTGYKIDKTQDNVIMHYKLIDKENLVAIQVHSQVDLTLQKFICIASQIQLYDKYVPFNYETTCLKQPARNKKIGRSKVFIPLLNNRQAYFEAKAYDRLQKQNCIFMFSKNLKKQHLSALNIQYKSQGLVDLDYIFFLLSYTPISKDKGVIKMATCIDMKISILPKFILNKTARIFAFDYFKNMININKKFQNSAWQKAILKKPEHYSFFKQKIDEYFNSKITPNQQLT